MLDAFQAFGRAPANAIRLLLPGWWETNCVGVCRVSLRARFLVGPPCPLPGESQSSADVQWSSSSSSACQVVFPSFLSFWLRTCLFDAAFSWQACIAPHFVFLVSRASVYRKELKCRHRIKSVNSVVTSRPCSSFQLFFNDPLSTVWCCDDKVFSINSSRLLIFFHHRYSSTVLYNDMLGVVWIRRRKECLLAKKEKGGACRECVVSCFRYGNRRRFRLLALIGVSLFLISGCWHAFRR